MQVIADLQIHSKYSRATSSDMNLEGIARGARLKGLNLMGTGDFTHPLWLAELKSKLIQSDYDGIYSYAGINWILSGEVSTVYEQDGKIRKIHHLIYAPSFDIVEQINEKLNKFSDLSSDGRPTLNGVSSPYLVELLMSISKDIVIVPAHAWTPHFSVFGSKSGFDSLEECYQDQTKNIFAIETGLSSDPPMNWRLSSLDSVALISNSDAHSPNPWRLGREANVFELDEPSYKAIFDAVRMKDRSRFLFTIEVDPSYGKYHFTGHRNCGVSLHPKEAIKLGNKCPKCKRKLTIGVLQRVEELADRPEGYRPDDAIPFKCLLPLYEIISFATGVKQLYSRSVLQEHDKIISAFGNELNVLMNVPREELISVTSERIADSIIKVREGKVRYEAGYDGEYGRPIFY